MMIHDIAFVAKERQRRIEEEFRHIRTIEKYCGPVTLGIGRGWILLLAEFSIRFGVFVKRRCNDSGG